MGIISMGIVNAHGDSSLALLSSALKNSVIKIAVIFLMTFPMTAQALQPIDPHAHHRQQAAAKSKMAMAEIELSDNLPLLNQFGEQVDLRQDIIGDKVVVVGFVYTTCVTVCPVVSSIFSLVQDKLKDKMDKEVALVMLTVDPTRDTPYRLLSYAKKYNAKKGWHWLTGDKKLVDKVLKTFGAYTPLFEDHPAMVLIGDETKSEWYRYYVFPAPEVIQAKVDELLLHRLN